MCNCMSKKEKAGDRIKLTENLTKKYLDILSIRKYLIHKGSMLGSLQMPKRNIYSLIPFAFSYLSIREETDKIHYILLYKYQKEAIGRRT